MAERTWKCQRVSGGVKCAHVNPKRRQLCEACGKRRPVSKGPAHREVLRNMDYAAFVAKYGEVCGVCGRSPEPGKKLHRDHAHTGNGFDRGLLCFRCNTSMPSERWFPGGDVIGWMERALEYLRRAEELRDRG